MIPQGGPFTLNRKLLQPEGDDSANEQVYMDINPHEADDEMCNYEVSDTPRDFFGKVLRESVAIVIVDDREDDEGFLSEIQ